MPFLGIDVGGTSVKLAAVEDGKVLWTGQSPPYNRPTTEELLAAIRAATAGKNVRADGVGLCVPGLLDKVKREITYSVNVPGLHGITLDELVRRALGEDVGRVQIVNDAVAGAHDVWATRRMKGRLLVMALGTGIGAAVLDDGVPLIVEGESPGHIGQFDVSLEGEPVIGPDGGAGGLEGYVGVRALAARYGSDVSAAVRKFRGDEPPIRALARAIRICHAIYRPHHICFTGGIGIRLGHVLPALRALVEKELTSVARAGWTLAVGDTDFHQSAGAAKIAAKHASAEN
jgi:glucokinase